MASNMAVMSFPVSSHTLHSDKHFSDVLSALRDVASEWEDLATNLKIGRAEVNEVKTDNPISCAACLRSILDVWFKSLNTPRSWRELSAAVKNLNNGLPVSESIAASHRCGCTICIGKKPQEISKEVLIVSECYNEIYREIKSKSDLERIAKYMVQEDAFTEDQIKELEATAEDNEVEVFFTLLESAIQANVYHLKIFATALKQCDLTKRIGESLLLKYRKEGLPAVPALSKEVVVDKRYKKEFLRMRTKLGNLCEKTLELLQEKDEKIDSFKRKLSYSFPEFGNDLAFCSSHGDVIEKVIRPELSVIEIDHLECIYDLFDLSTTPLDEYKKAVDLFMTTMMLEHTYGQMLMNDLNSHVSKYESITFVLDWKGNDHSLKDLEDLFKSTVKKKRRDMKVMVIHEGNSIVVECYVHKDKMSSVLSEIKENRGSRLAELKVMRIKAEGKIIFNGSELQTEGKRRIQLELPSVVKHITQTLHKYHDGAQILKELVQNADDAKATEVKFILDSSHHPTDGLIHENLAKFQGPALYAWNNGIFSDEDWNSFGKIEDSVKQHDSLKIGKFGMGFLSVFHLTDLPTVISSDKVVILDPSMVFTEPSMKAWNSSFRDFRKHHAHHSYFQSLQSCNIQPDSSDKYRATLFRFPLRDSPSKICEELYTPGRILDHLFVSFIQEAPIVLLFLKHVEEISLYDGNNLLYRVSISTANNIRSIVRSERNALVTLGERFLHNEKIPATLRCFSASIHIENRIKDTEILDEHHHWLILNMIGSERKETLDLSKKLKTNMPWVGVAASLPCMTELHGIEIPNVKQERLPEILTEIQEKIGKSVKCISTPSSKRSESRIGRAFCFLPLPQPTHLPINVHGNFAVSDDRRLMEWPGRDNKSNRARWNEQLVLHHLAPLYSVLIGSKCKLDQSLKVNVDPYSIWPDYDELKNETIWKGLMKPTIHGCISSPVFFASGTNQWVAYDEALLMPSSTEIPEIVLKVLVEGKRPVIALPAKVKETLEKSEIKQKKKVVLSSIVRQVLKVTKPVYSSFKEFEPLLEFILSDLNNIHSKNKTLQELMGLKIIPVAYKKPPGFTLRTLSDSNDPIYLIPEEMNGLLLGLEKAAIHPAIQKNKFLFLKFRELAMAEKSKRVPSLTRIKMADSDTLCNTLLFQSVQTWSQVKQRNECVKWDFDVNSPPFSWIENVWEWLRKNKGDVLKTIGLPILPKEKIDEDTKSCTLLPIPSSKQKYFIFSEEEKELALLLEKMNATVIAKNEFVFFYGKLSRSIIPITIPGVLDYLNDNYLAVDVLDSLEKEMLLLSIAHYFCSKQAESSKKSENPMSAQHADVICKLRIIPVGVGLTPVTYMTLNDKLVIPQDVNFDKDLLYPHNIIKIEHTDIFKLLQLVAKHEIIDPEDLYIQIFEFAFHQLNEGTSDNNGDELIAWILNSAKLHALRKLRKRLEEVRFIRTSADPSILKLPSELYNPDDTTAAFHKLLDASAYPNDYYRAKDLVGVLKQLGLRTWASISSSSEQFSDFLCEQAKNVKRAKSNDEVIQRGACILKLLSRSEFQLMSKLESIQFIQIEKCRPENFPKYLPWYGEKCKETLVAPKRVCYNGVGNIVGCVLPIIHSGYQNIQLPKSVTDHFLSPTVKNVLEQLNTLIQVVDRATNVKPEEISYIVREIYQFLDFNSQALIKLRLPDRWIWWNEKGTNCFLPSSKFVLKTAINLEPFIYCMKIDHSDIPKFKNLLKVSGIRKCPTDKDLMKVLKELSAIMPLNDEQIQMSISILEHLYHNEVESKDLLVPTIDNALQPIPDCLYDDSEWIVKERIGHLDKFHFVHGSISKNVAVYFDIKPLSMHVVKSKEIKLNYTQMGQKESLTHRLREIVEDYSGKIDIFKEFIQNADDAKATKIKFLMDWRQHGTKSLFTDEMSCWQGPAVVAYNDATFTDQDFKNICDLAGGSKKSDSLKIGQYGLGFCSCYTLTDVPSFISRRSLTIFDPHTCYLGERVSVRKPGMQIDLFKEKEGVAIYEDQFAPYNGLFDCNLSSLNEKGFNGTMFRLPLRMNEAKYQATEISNKRYTKSSISKRLDELRKQSKTLLLFLKNISSLEYYELEEGAKVEEMKLVFKVEKSSSTTLKQRTEAINTKEEFSECVRCEIFYFDSINQCNYHYLLSSAKVHDPSVNVKKGMMLLAELAVQVDDNLIPILNTGQFFCFLPLPSNHSLPFHINAYFDVTKDRQNLRNLDHKGEWNKKIAEIVFPRAFICLLKSLTSQIVNPQTCLSPTALKRYYSLWPSHVSSTETSISSLLCSSLQKTFKQLTNWPFYWSLINSGEWVSSSQAHLFDQTPEIYIHETEIERSCIEILLSYGYRIIDCPEHVRKTLEDTCTCKKVDYLYFIEHVFLLKIKQIKQCENRNLHLKYVLQQIERNTKTFLPLIDKLKHSECIPTSKGDLICPKNLIDDNSEFVSKLYSQSDGRFPDIKFKDCANALTILGMVTTELPLENLVERAVSVKNLDIDDGMERMEKILKYLCYIESQEQFSKHGKRKERIKALEKIGFLSFLPKPQNLTIPWKFETKHFLSPHQLYPRSEERLVFSQAHIFKSPFPDDKDQFRSVEEYLGIEKQANIEVVLGNICCLIDDLKNNTAGLNASTHDYINKVFIETYDFLNNHCNTAEQQNMIRSKLCGHLCIWQNGRLYHADQILISWNGKSHQKYLSCLTDKNRDYKKLFEVLNVKQEADFDFLVKVLSRVEKDTKGNPLSDEMFEFVVDIIENIHHTPKSKKKPIFLPDSNRFLRSSTDLCYKSMVIPISLKGDKHLLHSSISHMASSLGVQSTQDTLLKKNEDKTFFSSTEFYRNRDVAGFIHGFLVNNPQEDLAFKEVIKLAENTNINEVVFALDNRTDHPNEILLTDSENWRNLQNKPALCIVFNKPLSKKDALNLCKLEDKSSPFGNFNAVYHLTDCPSYASFDENKCPTEICVFDPLHKYCCTAEDTARIRRWVGTNSLNQFPDQFKPFLVDTINQLMPTTQNHPFTIFRLPLTYMKHDESHFKKLAKLKSMPTVRRLFSSSSESTFLFLKNLSRLSMFEIEEDNNTVCHFSTSWQRQKISKRIINIGNTWKYCCETSLQDQDSKKQSKWLITECNELSVKTNLVSLAKSKGLFPGGGVALNLNSSQVTTSFLYQVLPTAINTGLPVSINACLLLDDQQEGHEQWNKFIYEQLLVPLYIELILQAREYVNDHQDCSAWFYSAFPRQSTSLQFLIEVFYEALVNHNHAVLLDARCEQISWLKINEAYFLAEDTDAIVKALYALKMPITCAPMFICESLSQTSTNYTKQDKCGAVNTQRLCSYLRSLSLNETNTAVLRESHKSLLQFCFEHNSSKDSMAIVLVGVPLLLTYQNTLSSEGHLFESAFVKLLPEREKEFVYPMLEYSEVGRKLKEHGVIIDLSINHVAKYIRLQDTITPVTLDSNQISLLQYLWSFLEQAIKSRLCDEKDIANCFRSKPVIPTDKGFYPLGMSKQVFKRSSESDVIRKLGYPILDIHSPTFFNLFVASSNNPDELIACMAVSKPILTETLTKLDLRILLNIVNSCEEIPHYVLSCLQGLPIFQTVDKTTFHSLNEAKVVCVLPEDVHIPSNGLAKIQKATLTLIFRESQMNQYRKLIHDSQSPTPIQFYLQFVLPNMDCFSEDELRSHLTVVKNWVCDSSDSDIDQNEIDQLKAILKEKWLITVNETQQQYHIHELYDPRVEFHVLFHKDKLVPQKWAKGDWLQFLKILGLKSDVTTDVWLQSAQTVAEQGSTMSLRSTVNQVTKQSDALLKMIHTLIKTELSGSYQETAERSISPQFQSFLQSAAKIPFIHNKNAADFREKVEKFTDQPVTCNASKAFIPFNNSFLNPKDKKISLLCHDVLPHSCEFISDCGKDVISALSILTNLDDLIVDNLVALSDHLCNTNVRKFVLSQDRRRAIQSFKKVFEDYYEMLNKSTVDSEHLQKQLQTKRCVFSCPNEFSFHLLQPSQVVLRLTNDLNLVPFCYQLPSNLLKYETLWHSLKIKKEIDPELCLKILANIKAEISRPLHEADPYWNVAINTYNMLIELLQNEGEKSTQAKPLKPNLKIILPAEGCVLKENTELVFNDMSPQLQDALKQEKSFPYKFVHPPPKSDQFPKVLGVRLLSDITSEQLDDNAFNKTNNCTEQELFELKRAKYNCDTIVIVSEKLRSDELKDGIMRLYWEKYKKNPTEDKEFQQKLQTLKSDMNLLCKKNVTTVIKFQRMLIKGTENKRMCYMNTAKKQLLIAHSALYFQDYMFYQLAKILSKYFDLDFGNPLVTILNCPLKDITNVLDGFGISKYDSKQKTSSEVDVGQEVPFYEVARQTTEDMLIFCDYEEGEKVLYQCVKAGKPKCFVARIQKCPMKNGINLNDKYVKVCVGTAAAETVSLLQVYKILNPSQRNNLTSGKHSQFCQPVVVAHLPETQEELNQWISNTFDYNNSHPCCSFTPLVRRILSHLYYSLVKSVEQQELFLEVAEHILRTAKNSRNDAGKKHTIEEVIRTVQNFPNLKIDETSELVAKLPAQQPTTPKPQPLRQQQPFYPPDHQQWQRGPPFYHQPQYPFFPQEFGYYINQRPPQQTLFEGQPRLREIIPKPERAGVRVKYKLVPIRPSSIESHPNQLAAKAWLQQAKADFIAASDVFSKLLNTESTGAALLLGLEKDPTGRKETKYPALVCFLCHDAVEKFIKGVMYSKTGVPSHLLSAKNLSILVDEIEKSKIGADDFLDVVKSTVSSISVHGDQSRYPSYHYPPVSPANMYTSLEANESLALVEQLMTVISQNKDFSEMLGDMAEIETFGRTTLLKSSEKGDVPEFWARHERRDGHFKLVLLDRYEENVEEFQVLESTFQATLPNYMIERIERIQNKLLWHKYYACAKRMMEFNKGVVNETTLFHGTSETDPENIYKGDDGFDMKCSRDGWWGRGNYFAVNASFSDSRYAYDCGDGFYQLLVATVLVGYHKHMPRDKGIKKPPVRDNTEGITRRYDSVSGTTGQSKVYITYENDHAYPAYLITYSREQDDSEGTLL